MTSRNSIGRQISHWFRALPRRKKMENELDTELRFDLDHRAEANVRAGMSPEEARHAALRAFGGVELAKEESRDARGTQFLEQLLQDVRFGLRMMRKSPGFTAIAILTLAVGIGANTAIFSMVNGILIRALPYSQPEQLYAIHEVVPELSSYAPILPVNTGNFLLWKERCPAFSGMAALLVYPSNLTGQGQPSRVDVAHVSWDFFSLMRVQPQLGRAFFAAEDSYGQNRVVVLTYQLWQDAFQSDSEVLGRTIALDGNSYSIVGVLPRDFQFPEISGRPPQLFTPLGLRGPDLVSGIGNFNYTVIARLKPEITAGQALTQINTVETSIALKGDTFRGVAPGQFHLHAVLTPLRTLVVGPIQQALWILMAAAAFVLLIICVNLANLTLVRNAGRAQEVAVRRAMGASVRRLAQQLLTEAFFLGAMGGVLGLLFAFWGLKLLVRNAPLDIPRVDNVRIDSPVLWFTLTVSVIAAVLFALLPALRAARVAPAEVLKSVGRTSSGGKQAVRLRSGLVICEIALSSVLLAGALLLVQSLTRVIDVNRWMEKRNVLAINLTAPLNEYKTEADRYQFFSRVLEKVQGLPGIDIAALTSKIPLRGDTFGDDIQFKEAPQPAGKVPVGQFIFVSPGYLSAIGMPLIRGRWFSPADQGQDLAVVSEAIAKNVPGGRDPIGMHLVWEGKTSRVIGVVGDVRTASDNSPTLAAYIPFWTFNQITDTLVVQTAIDPSAEAAVIRSGIWSVDRQVAIPPQEILSTIVNRSIATRQYVTLLSVMFAGLAMLLAALGLYGVISYSVSQRAKEMGIRVALGAQPRKILVLVLAQGARWALFGVGIGIVAALMFTRVMSSMLFGVSAGDPMTLAGVAGLLMLVALLACYIPARRATRVDPMTTLRNE